MSQKEDDNKKKAFQHLGESLALIQDGRILASTLAVLAARTPEHFWYFPASTSGKHHPPQARDKYGLVWHTNVAVQWGIRLLKRIENEHPHGFVGLRDRVVQALILHDLWKNGRHDLVSWQKDAASRGKWCKGPTGITGTHGGMLAVVLLDTGASVASDVVEAIGAHMGPWTDDMYDFWTNRNSWTKPAKDLIETVQCADFCASQYFGDPE